MQPDNFTVVQADKWIRGLTPENVLDASGTILALSALEVEPRLARSAYRVEELKEAIANAKKYLVSQQRPDGSWPETTRPANQESYAQRISTTGWAMLALLTP